MWNREGQGRQKPQTFSDDQTRNTNFTMMQKKRKQQLEEQLENKEGLLRQYTNPRGIGMRGQTVNPRDVEILQEQIQQIKQQLEQITNPGGAQALAPPPGSVAGGSQWGGSQASVGGGSQPGSSMGMQPGQAPPQGRIRGDSAGGMQMGQQQQQGFQNQNPGSYPMSQQQQPPSNAGGLPFGGNGTNRGPGSMGGASRISKATTGARSKRDEVYERKYQNWLERTSTRGGGGSQASGPVLTSLKINNSPFAPQNQPAQSGAMSSASGYQNNGTVASTSQITTSTGVGGRHRDQPASSWGGQAQPAPVTSQQPAPGYGQQRGGSQAGGSQFGGSQPSQAPSQQGGWQQQQQQRGGMPPQQQQPPQNQWGQGQQQPQQAPQYGRRATPTDGQRPPMAPQQQQPPQQQQGGNFFTGGGQPQQQQQPGQPIAGRRSAGGSRPW